MNETMIGKYKLDFNIPQDVRDLLNKLHTKYEAYIVGGCVRDLLLGRTPKDYDITTNAKPDEIKELFKDYELINNNGEKHGTVTVRYNGENYEITTYRLDGKYTDHRHPDEVVFTSNLQEDLSRRDFTINALVYDGKYVLDYFGGVNDLDNKIIKTVGNAYDRFDEDALRILRMLRFASVLDFEIEDNTLLAAEELKNNLFTIAKERKTTELNKLVCGKGFARILTNVLAYNIL
jgi:tRNA nucleotidyltransferase (CCA-adding enzyme)